MVKSITLIKSLATASLLATTSLFAQGETAAPAELSAEALEAFGWAVAQNGPLAFEYSDEQLNSILAGVRKASTGEDLSSTFEANQEAIQAFFMHKQMAAHQKMQAEAEKQAEEQAKLSGEFFTALEQNEDIKKSDSGLYYEITEEGNDKRASDSDQVEVHYHGELLDGTVFDSSVERGEPVTFPLGGVIPGFSEGLKLIGEGGKATLYIPAELGYGNRPAGSIPPGSTLKFQVELIKIVPGDS